ncbi:hypothetical protein GCM10025784_29890 [Citricoccus nitrophenolicus]
MALVLSACGTNASGAGSSGGEDPAQGTASEEAGEPAEPVNAAQLESRAEVASLTPRVVLAHEGGLVTLDGESGEVVHAPATTTKSYDHGYRRESPMQSPTSVIVTEGGGLPVSG